MTFVDDDDDYDDDDLLWVNNSKIPHILQRFRDMADHWSIFCS